MTPPAGWQDAAAGFLAAHLPRVSDDDGDGWDHMFSSAYQIGCMALAALGHAQETEWGAVPLSPPVRPDRPPRWDDVAVAVLWLAEQQGLLAFRLADGSVPERAGQFVVRVVGAPPPPAPNIAAAHGLGPAHVDPPHPEWLAARGVAPPSEPGARATLAALGLVADGAWTAAAETVLWRGWPREWDQTFEADPRFIAAAEAAADSAPSDILREVERIVTVDEEAIDAERGRQEAHWLDYRQRMERVGGLVAPIPEPSEDDLRRSLMSSAPDRLDRLFFRRWRLADGWLPPDPPERALAVFHDRLAIAVRRSVMARLHPDRPDLAKP